MLLAQTYCYATQKYGTQGQATLVESREEGTVTLGTSASFVRVTRTTATVGTLSLREQAAYVAAMITTG